MRKIGLRWALGMAVVTAALASSGCVAVLMGAAAGAGGYAWVNGTLVKNYDHTAVELEDATEAALDHLGLKITTAERDRLVGRYIARFADGQGLSVRINAVTERTCKLSIRVGMLGNVTRSELVLDEIESRL